MKIQIIHWVFMLIGSLLLQICFPIWWIFVPYIFIVAMLLDAKTKRSFLYGFSAIFLLWFFWCLKIDLQNQFILSMRVSQLFHLPASFLLGVITSIIGGIVGGLASWSGFLFRRIINKD